MALSAGSRSWDRIPWLWVSLLAALSAFATPVAVAQTGGGSPWTRVDAAHGRLDYAGERNLLETLRDRLHGNVQWAWRMARLEFDEAYQMKDEDRRKASMLRKGLEYARSALKIDEACAQAHLYYAMIIGHLSYHEGNEARIRVAHEVKQHGLRALALDPDSAAACHMMGRWHYELADLSWVERTLAEALYGRLPDASVDEAVGYFKRARRLEPDNVSHGLWLAKSLLREDRDDEAKTVLEATVRLSPPDDAGRLDLAEARKLLDKLK